MEGGKETTLVAGEADERGSNRDATHSGIDTTSQEVLRDTVLPTKDDVARVIACSNAILAQMLPFVHLISKATNISRLPDALNAKTRLDCS